MASSLENIEKITERLKEIYRNLGYRKYKMGKFEDYDFYAANRDFLRTGRILAFTDGDGKLMALKPDVTLSIIKNLKEESKVKKLFYLENVYRTNKQNGCFKEILQTGVECIGEIDCYLQAEVITLAVSSLETISSNYVVVISHTELLDEMLKEICDNEVFHRRILKEIENKSIHEAEKICREYMIPQEKIQILKKIMKIHHKPEETIEILRNLDIGQKGKESAEELEKITKVLKGAGKNVIVDFSITENRNYYSGILFEGYIEGVSDAVVSGGRYDRLLKKIGRNEGAIGFAIYMDRLLDFFKEEEPEPAEIVINYSEKSDPEEIGKEIGRLLQENKRFRLIKSEQ